MTDPFAGGDGADRAADHHTHSAAPAGSPDDRGSAAGSAADDERVGRRAADLLPEERGPGSADPEAQAAAILAESDEREADLEASPSSFLEHRTSDETMPSGESTR